MKRNQSFGEMVCAAFLVLSFVSYCFGEKGVLVIHVEDTHGRPLKGVEIAAQGPSGTGTSDRLGIIRIKLTPDIKPGDLIPIQIIPSGTGKELVLISPWDSNALVRPFDKENINFFRVVIGAYGDRALLGDQKALASLRAKILKARVPKQKEQGFQQPREALVTIAKASGLPAEDLDKAIRSLGDKTNDPYQKGMTYLYIGNYPQANQSLARSLEIREKNLANAQVAAADAAFFLGQARYDEGQYSESIVAFQRTLSLRPDDSSVMAFLGESLQSAGDYGEAEHLFWETLRLDEKALGPDHPNVALDWANLAAVLEEQGDLVQAESLARRALEIDRKSFGLDHPSLANDFNTLGLVLKKKHDYTEAESLYWQALAIARKAPGPNREVAGILNNLAELLRAKGDGLGAEPLYREALEIVEKTLGPDHPMLSRILNNLALLLTTRRDFEEAESLFRKALSIDEKALGPDHPVVGTHLNNLAGLLMEKRDYASAEPLVRRALAIHEKSLRGTHPNIAADLNNLAGLLATKRDYAEAESLYRRALIIDEYALGSEDPTTQRIQNNLDELVKRKEKAGQPQ